MNKTKNLAPLFVLAFLLGCSGASSNPKVKAENFQKITIGMSTQQVVDILGTPPRSGITKENIPPLGEWTVYGYNGKGVTGSVWLQDDKVIGVTLDGNQILKGPTIKMH